MEDMSQDWAKAAMGGGAAVAAYYLLFAILTVNDMPLAGAIIATLVVVFIAWMIATICTFLGILFIGLPMSWMLRRAGAENVVIYALAGAGSGFLMPLLIGSIGEAAVWNEGTLLVWAVPGAIAGGTCGFLWGRSRAGLARRSGPMPANRIEDPRMLR